MPTHLSWDKSAGEGTISTDCMALEDVSVISNSGEVDSLKVAALKRMKNACGSQAP